MTDYHRTYLIQIIIGLIVLIGLCRCPASAASHKIILQLDHDHHFLFAGYCAAIYKGFYGEKDLSVTLTVPDGGGRGCRPCRLWHLYG